MREGAQMKGSERRGSERRGRERRGRERREEEEEGGSLSPILELPLPHPFLS